MTVGLIARRYNSTFFVSFTNNSYDIYFASQDFQNGEPFDSNLLTDIYSTDSHPMRNSTIHYSDGTAFSYVAEPVYFTRPSAVQEQAQRYGHQENGSLFERLDNADCIEAYAKTPLFDRRTLILVSSTTPRNNHQLDFQRIVNSSHDTLYVWGNCRTSHGLPILGPPNLYSCLDNSSLYTVKSYHSGLIPAQVPIRSNWFAWICSQPSEYHEEVGEQDNDLPPLCGEGHWQAVKSNASRWTVDGFEVDYCISERLEDGCKLNMAGRLLIVVIVMNTIVCRTWTSPFR